VFKVLLDDEGFVLFRLIALLHVADELFLRGDLARGKAANTVLGFQHVWRVDTCGVVGCLWRRQGLAWWH